VAPPGARVRTPLPRVPNSRANWEPLPGRVQALRAGLYLKRSLRQASCADVLVDNAGTDGRRGRRARVVPARYPPDRPISRFWDQPHRADETGTKAGPLISRA